MSITVSISAVQSYTPDVDAEIPVREFEGPPVRGAASPRRVRPTSYLSES